MATVTYKIVNGDFVLDDSTGRFVTVSGHDKLRQDVEESLSIDQLPDGRGAGLDEMIGFVGDNGEITTEVQIRIATALGTLKSFQSNVQRAFRDPKELLSRIAQIVVAPLQRAGQANPSRTIYTYRVDVVSADKDSDVAQITGLFRP